MSFRHDLGVRLEAAMPHGRHDNRDEGAQYTSAVAARAAVADRRVSGQDNGSPDIAQWRGESPVHAVRTRPLSPRTKADGQQFDGRTGSYRDLVGPSTCARLEDAAREVAPGGRCGTTFTGTARGAAMSRDYRPSPRRVNSAGGSPETNGNSSRRERGVVDLWDRAVARRTGGSCTRPSARLFVVTGRVIARVLQG